MLCKVIFEWRETSIPHSVAVLVIQSGIPRYLTPGIVKVLVCVVLHRLVLRCFFLVLDFVLRNLVVSLIFVIVCVVAAILVITQVVRVRFHCMAVFAFELLCRPVTAFSPCVAIGSAVGGLCLSTLTGLSCLSTPSFLSLRRSLLLLDFAPIRVALITLDFVVFCIKLATRFANGCGWKHTLKFSLESWEKALELCIFQCSNHILRRDRLLPAGLSVVVGAATCEFDAWKQWQRSSGKGAKECVL